MFPLSLFTYAKIGIVCLLVLGSGYTGYALEAARFDRYKAEQMAQVQKVEKEYQAATDEIRKKKNEKISSINSQLNNALVQLRSRPNRTNSASDGQTAKYCTGAQLYAEDAELALREAVRADTIREALNACYKQYDSLK